MREVVGCCGGGGVKVKIFQIFFHSKYFLLSTSSGRNSTLSLKHSLGLWGRRHSTVKTENILENIIMKIFQTELKYYVLCRASLHHLIKYTQKQTRLDHHHQNKRTLAKWLNKRLFIISLSWQVKPTNRAIVNYYILHRYIIHYRVTLRLIICQIYTSLELTWVLAGHAVRAISGGEISGGLVLSPAPPLTHHLKNILINISENISRRLFTDRPDLMKQQCWLERLLVLWVMAATVHGLVYLDILQRRNIQAELSLDLYAIRAVL